MNKEIEYFIKTADYHELIDFMVKANRRVSEILNYNIDDWSEFILNNLGMRYEDYLTCVPVPVKIEHHKNNCNFDCNDC
jgi:hypothetical protein